MPKSQNTTIEIKNQALGGISDSDYLGLENSVSKMVGFNLHSEPGIMKVNQKFTKVSGTTITELCKHAVYASNGESYFFSSESGKIWRIKSDFTVELAYTTVASVGESKCLGADEYNGYIVWYTQNKVHRISLANALVATWTTLNLNWQAFAVGDLLYHPSSIQNDVLYIGDNYEVAALDDATWTATGALNIKVRTGAHRISAMMNFTTGILFGTITVAVNAIMALWNTWSTHITGKDELPEQGVNCFLKMDNYAIASVGRKGNFYSFNGSIGEQVRKIPGDWDGGKEAVVYPGSNANRFGLPLFGVSNYNGNPCPQGIYSVGKYSAGYNNVLNLEYPISTGNLSNIEIGAVVLRGYDMLVAWKDSTDPEAIVCGVDKLDHSNKISGAYFETRVIELNPDQVKEFTVDVYYRLLPTGTNITLQVQKDYGSWSDVITLANDAKHKRKYTSVKIKASTAKFRVITSASVNTAPEFRTVRISYP